MEISLALRDEEVPDVLLETLSSIFHDAAQSALSNSKGGENKRNDAAGKSLINSFGQLKKQHPEIYQALIYQGVMIERERVLAHLKVAGVYDCLYESIEAIAEGVPANLILGEVIPYTVLHDRYALLEDQRDELECIAATQCR